MNMKTTNKYTYNHSFDELLTAKLLFEQRVVSEDKQIGKRIISITKAFYKNSAMGEILRLVSKYLLHADIYESEEDKQKYQTPSFVRQLVWKWLVVVIYKNLQEPGTYEPFAKFDEGINVYDLINLELTDDSIYKKLLSNDKKSYDEVAKTVKKKYGDVKANLVKSMHRLNMNFFQYDQDLKYYVGDSNTKKIELIVCEVMLDNVFEKFDFEILDMDAFKENLNLIEKGKATQIRDAYIFTGLFLNDLKKHKIMREYDYNRNRVNLATLDKDFTVSNVVKFISDDVIAKRDIAYSKVVPFKFKLNDVTYSFSKDGIRKANVE